MPLVGAALIAAAEIDGLVFGRASRVARCIGLGWLAGCALLLPRLAELGLPAPLARMAGPRVIGEIDAAGMPAQALFAAGAALVIAGTLHAWLRLRRIGRGDRVGPVPLALGAAAAIALGAWLVPERGPVAAAWSATAGACLGALAELAGPRRRRGCPRNQV